MNSDPYRLHEYAVSLLGRFPHIEEFTKEIVRRLLPRGDKPCYSIMAAIMDVCDAIYAREFFHVLDLPPPQGYVSNIELARYRDRLSDIITKLSAPNAIELATDTLVWAFGDFLRSLPKSVYQDEKAFLATAEAGGHKGLAVDLLSFIESPGDAIMQFAVPFYREEAKNIHLFDEVRQALRQRQHDMSGIPLSYRTVDDERLINPNEYNGTPQEIVKGYLRGTPFETLFDTKIPFAVPDQIRFEHQWIVAGSGHGKTQTLQYLIADDIPKVIAGEASIVVIDSQGDLIRNVAGLQVFAAHPDRLCLIDPTDVEYPVALNLFDVGLDRINRYSLLDRERLINGILELYDFVMGSLLSAELTQKQGVIFRYITRLMLHIPNANIQTLRELMEPQGYEKYREYIGRLQGTARAFFETEFNSREFADTKRQVVRRLWGILENPTFERMFSHPRNKLDLFSELNAGKVILINTAKELLKQNGSELFGRFFIAMIAQAAQERAVLSRRLPTFVYVDECQDYLDQNVSLILEQARKYNVGMVLAHQYLGQLGPKLLESFAANTSIKFAGGVSDRDARAFAGMLRTDPEFIERQPKGHFAAFVRNRTDQAVSLRIPFGRLEAMERMGYEDEIRVRDAMRTRYAVHYKEVQQSIAEQLMPSEVCLPAPVAALPRPVQEIAVPQPAKEIAAPLEPPRPKPASDAASEW